MFSRLLSPAKINLHLRVAPPNSDGFHPLMSWMTTVGLFDKLTFHSEEAGAANSPHGMTDRLSLSMTCTDPTIPCDESNLVAKAIRAMERVMQRSEYKHNRPTKSGLLSVHLEKRIPAGGGLGGGSSNAAATLMALGAEFDPPLPSADLSAAAAGVGSDVAFFIGGSSSICTGRGECVVPIRRPMPQWVMLILPGIAMPTPAVYRKFDEMKLGDAGCIHQEPDWNAWVKLPAKELLPLLVNDLEAPAFAIEPALEKLQRSAEKILGRPVRMSGSGSTLFTLYDEKEEAQVAARQASEQLDVPCLAAKLAPAIEDNDDEGPRDA